jgi:hypothetical protein
MFRQFSRWAFLGMAFWILCGFSNIAAPALFAQAAPIEPAKSFEDVPQLAKSSAEVKARYGDIINSEGKKVKGDTQAEKVIQRLRQWTKDLAEQAMVQAMHPPAMGAGTIGPATGRMVQLLQTTMMKLNGEEQKAAQTYGQTVGQLDDEYDKNLSQINSDFETRLERGGCRGTTPTYTIDCRAVAKQRNDAILKAGDTYLGKLATPYGTLRMKMNSVATEAQSVLDQANKTFGGRPPFFAQAMVQGLTTAGMGALDEANSTESDAVVLVYEKSVATTKTLIL